MSLDDRNVFAIALADPLGLGIQPGDIIAFSGTDLPSTVVKLATQSDYVHVAIVFAVIPNQNPDQTVLIAESHIDTSLPSLGTGQPILGVQFHWLSQRLSLPGPVWWAALKQPLPVDRVLAMQTWLSQVERQRVAYDFLQAIQAGLEVLFSAELTLPTQLKGLKDDHAFFCSELVTRALQVAGAIAPDINAAEQIPATVMTFPCLQPPILIKSS
jgi:hypothetical protein